jgi:hypothetical protein
MKAMEQSKKGNPWYFGMQAHSGRMGRAAPAEPGTLR